MAIDQRPRFSLLRPVFFMLVKLLVLVLLGMQVRRRHLLPKKGPAILVANHNSHLDTLVLMSLYPLRRLPQLRPVAAADYFMKSGWMAWFSRRIIGVIAIDRGHGRDGLLACQAALARNEILILFPEGTRGQPEEMRQFKKGIAHLAARHPQVPIIPIFMHGLGKALPKDDWVLVPFFCDIFIGDPYYCTGGKQECMQELAQRFSALAAEGPFGRWE